MTAPATTSEPSITPEEVDQSNIEVEEISPHSWQKKDTGDLGKKIPAFKQSQHCLDDMKKIKNCKDNYDFYKLFSPEHWANHVVFESRRYGYSRGFPQEQINQVNKNTFRCTEAFFIWSGFNGAPQVRMNWELCPEVRSEYIANNLRRTEVEAVLRCLHFRDNKLMDDDRYFKIRPIFNILNSGGRFFLPYSQRYAVDESMVPYFGRHGTKQFIMNKPVRYGFKIWCICSENGVPVHMEPYCGKSTLIRDLGMGCGPNVVASLIEKAGIQEGCEIYCDNLFTSLPLLKYCSERGFAITGTVRSNRIIKAPIKQKKELDKKAVERGTTDCVYSEDAILVGWKDNRSVYVASNKYGLLGEQQDFCIRYCREKKQYIKIPIPHCIKKYNAGMGFVDMMDGAIASKRPQYKGKKWWFSFWTYCLGVQTTQAWKLKQLVTGEKEPYLKFLRDLVVCMFNKHGKKYRCTPASLSVQDSRFDRVDHVPGWIAPSQEKGKKSARRNCKMCTLNGIKDSKTASCCTKCNVPLHFLPDKNYFAKYHERPA